MYILISSKVYMLNLTFVGDIVFENEIVMYYVDTEDASLAVYYILQRENAIPNLIGEWHYETLVGYVKEKQYLVKGNSGTFVISEQHGHVFTGYKLVKTIYTDEHREDLSGIISKDGKKLYIAEHNDGYAFADIIDADTIHSYYLEDGELKTMNQVLTKVK